MRSDRANPTSIQTTSPKKYEPVQLINESNDPEETQQDEETIDISFNEDIFTAIALIFDGEKCIYKRIPMAAKILILFFGIACGIIQVGILQILRRGPEFLWFDAVIKDTINLQFARILALFAMTLYISKFYNTNISMYILLHSKKDYLRFLLFVPMIAINTYLIIDTIIIGGDLMLIAESNLDVFNAALTLFFVLEIDEWTFDLIKGHVPGLKNEMFEVSIKLQDIKDKFITEDGVLSFGYIFVGFFVTFLCEMFEIIYPFGFWVTETLSPLVCIIIAVPWFRFLYLHYKL